MSRSRSAAEEVVETIAGAASSVRAELPKRREIDERNPSDERLTAAERSVDDLLVDRIGAIEGVGSVATEERETPVDVGEGLAVGLDPVDGSSNIASNNLVGTVFGVYDEPLPAGGDALVAAGFVVYGPTTTMVVARNGRVREELVVEGERNVIDEELRLPAEPGVYGFGGRVADWTESFAAFAETVRTDPSIKLRYGGSMVGDVNQVLAYGGMFSYPALESAPDGKFRLQFEGIPIAAVFEAAGGASSDGTRSLLAVEPDRLHERTPFHVGDPDLIDRLEETTETNR